MGIIISLIYFTHLKWDECNRIIVNKKNKGNYNDALDLLNDLLRLNINYNFVYPMNVRRSLFVNCNECVYDKNNTQYKFSKQKTNTQ